MAPNAMSNTLLPTQMLGLWGVTFTPGLGKIVNVVLVVSLQKVLEPIKVAVAMVTVFVKGGYRKTRHSCSVG